VQRGGFVGVAFVHSDAGLLKKPADDGGVAALGGEVEGLVFVDLRHRVDRQGVERG
jgi:hypothetical protein